MSNIKFHKEFKKRLIEEGLDPNNVTKFITKFNSEKKHFITTITMKGGGTHTISYDDWLQVLKQNNNE
jgi:hypothetical protein